MSLSQLALSRPPRRRGPCRIEELDVRLARAGERQAFDRLVRRHHAAVVAAAWSCLRHREDALDAAQETFLKAYIHLRGFRGGASFRTWVVRIALNTARSLRERERAQKRRPEAGSCRLPAGAAANHVSAPHDPVEHRELVEALRREIAALDATAREVVERRAAGKSYGEIAAALGLCAGTVKSRLHRARTELRARLAAVL